MDVVVPVLVVLLLAAVVVWFLLSPLSGDDQRAGRRARAHAPRGPRGRREAKYREIREAELDRRTGKLDEGDWRAIDRQLRAEAVAILRELDELGAARPTRTRATPTSILGRWSSSSPSCRSSSASS